MLPEGLPKYSIGLGVLNWGSQMLVNPDSRGGIKGAQWVYRPDQAHFLMWWYAVDEEGEWVYRRGYQERAKQSGKSPFAAALACSELLGPVEFSHFECEHGQTPKAHCASSRAVGKERQEALVYLCAIAKDGVRHTYNYVYGMLQGPAQKAYNLDIGLSRILIPGRGEDKMLRAITASHRTIEGSSPTFVLAEETQHWIPGEHGPDFMLGLTRSAVKKNGRVLEVTNAPQPGEGTVAEETKQRWDEICSGEEEDLEGLLYDAVGVHVDDIYDAAQAIPALEKIYQHSPWVNIKRIFREYKDMPESTARRFYFNETIPPEEMWISKTEWRSAKRDIKLKKSDLVSFGFKFTLECAALCATRIEDGAVFVLKLWERPAGLGSSWEVSYLEIDKYVRWALTKYNVFNMMVSPENIPEIAGRWAEEWEDEIPIEAAWFSRSKQKYADAVHMFESGLHNNNLIHDGHPDLERHVMNCFVEIVPQGSLLKMETSYSNRYITSAQAAILSFKAAQEAIQDGALKEEASRVIYSI